VSFDRVELSVTLVLNVALRCVVALADVRRDLTTLAGDPTTPGFVRATEASVDFFHLSTALARRGASTFDLSSAAKSASAIRGEK
jgi:hypothetical protein